MRLLHIETKLVVQNWCDKSQENCIDLSSYVSTSNHKGVCLDISGSVKDDTDKILSK